MDNRKKKIIIIVGIVVLVAVMLVVGLVVVIDKMAKNENKQETQQEHKENEEEKENEQQEETRPFLPDSSFSAVQGTNFENGFVITDGVNEYVWIEVPMSVTRKATTDEEIEKALEEYASDYRFDRYTDKWVDSEGKDEGTDKVDLTDTSVWGLSLEEYNRIKSRTLQTIKAYGGFWIGRYEMGIEGRNKRFEYTETVSKAVSAPNKIPYNSITCAEAQSLATKVSEGKNYNSSLMLGIQWDLVCKFIEEKGAKTKEELKEDSTGWGNFYKINYKPDRGLYSMSGFDEYKDITKEEISTKRMSGIFTTGAADRNMAMNIYDLAGNLEEWTLETRGNMFEPCVCRGGGFVNADKIGVNMREEQSEKEATSDISGRVMLYL